MRYTERDLKTKYTSFMDYVESIIELLLLSPLRLINEISKKVVYLQKKRIERLLIVAMGIATLIIVIESLIQLTFNSFYLIGGTFSIIFQLIALIIICVFYGFIRNYDFSVSEQMESVLQTKQNSDEKNTDKIKNYNQVDREEFFNEDGIHNKEEMAYSNQEDTKDNEVIQEKDLSQNFNAKAKEEFIEEANVDFTDDFEIDDFDLNNLSTKEFNDFAGITDPLEKTIEENSRINELEKLTEKDSKSKNISSFSGKETDFVTEDRFNSDNLFNDRFDLSEYDCASHSVTEFVNNDLLENQEVKNYKNKHIKVVEKLKERDKTYSKGSLFSTEELNMIQQMCDQAVKESKFIDDNLIQIALTNQKYDDFSQIDDFMENDNVDWLQNI